jgi:hypothetical protein
LRAVDGNALPKSFLAASLALVMTHGDGAQ